MTKEDNRFIAYLVLGIVVVMGLIFWGVGQDNEISFCRRALSGLIKGDVSVEKSLEWPAFKAIGNDIGAEYSKLPNENERVYFRKAFILNLALAFKNAGGRFNAFTNWRLADKDSQKTIVAVDGLGNKTLLFTVVKISGKRKLVALQWKG